LGEAHPKIVQAQSSITLGSVVGEQFWRSRQNAKTSAGSFLKQLSSQTTNYGVAVTDIAHLSASGGCIDLRMACLKDTNPALLAGPVGVLGDRQRKPGIES
jgi:hypothetical protein